MTENESYKQVRPLVVRLAGWYAMKWNLDKHELIGEAQIEALKAIRSFREDYGTKLETWVYTYVDKYFKSKVRWARWRRRVGKDTPQFKGDYQEKRDRDRIFHQLFIDLTAEAKWVVNIIFDRQIGSKHGLFRLLRNEFGWHKYLIQCVYDEIKEALS